jgi:hypothetical protein
LLQAVICRQNPVTGVWHERFRGFVDDLNYGFDPSQQVNRLELTLVDLFELLANVELLPGEFGDVPPIAPADSADQVIYMAENMQDRINRILTDCQIPDEFSVVFSGNVYLHTAIYSPGETALSAVWEACDAEFPGVSNIYCDRFGRICVHGRLAKFDPAGTAASAGSSAWDFQQWKAGDGAAAAADGTHATAQIRRFSFNRGLAKIINSAYATPLRYDIPLTTSEQTGQVVIDTVSRDTFGIRSWSAPDLLTQQGLLDSSDDLTETKRFSTYYVENYAEPRNRVTDIAFRSINPDDVRGPAVWKLLSQVDIADAAEVTVASPGGGGFNLEPYFVEGVHEQTRPLNPDYDDVTLTLDLSPQAYFTSNPFPTS